MTNDASDSPLGNASDYIDVYSPALLFPIARKAKRQEIGLQDQLPFHGYDAWTAYELSWLNPNGKPEIAIANIKIPCQSPFLIESKSFKLYLNSFNQTPFESIESVQKTLVNDLSLACGKGVDIEVFSASNRDTLPLIELPGTNIDSFDIVTNIYQPNPKLLQTSEDIVTETLHSHLLKSNCLVTHQPDWGSVCISYQGPQIDGPSLLKYIVSFRQHNEFHEQCIERMFHDILVHCKPNRLTVFGRYTRRGGLDINPFRSNFESSMPQGRLPRQ